MKPVDLSADIVFVTDSSSTVTRPEYKKEREFLKALARQLNVSPRKSRASMVTYGRNSRVENKFDEYRTTSEFEQIVDEALYMGGARKIDRAVDTTLQVLAHARLEAKKIVVFFIAGQDGRLTKQLQKATKKIRDQKSNLFLVAFGRMSQVRNLESIVDKPQNIFRIPSYEDSSTWVIPTASVIAAQSGIYKKYKFIQVYSIQFSCCKTDRNCVSSLYKYLIRYKTLNPTIIFVPSKLSYLIKKNVFNVLDHN